MHFFARILILIVAFKYRRIVRITMYFESINWILEAMLPTGTDLSHDATLMIIGSYMIFVMSYFKFLPSLFAVEVSLIPFFTFRYVFYYEDGGMLAMSAVFYMLNLGIAITFMHLIMTKVGMIFVEAEVLREGNE